MGFFQRKNHFPVEGRTVLITGGSQGMGKALAVLLASKGAHVIIVARSVEKLEAALKEICASALYASKQRFHYLSADVTSPTEATRLLSEATTWNQDEPPSLICCCAGSAHTGYFLDLPSDALKSQMDTNYLSAAYIAHAACQTWLSKSVVTNPHSKKTPTTLETRHIIFISSILAFLPLTGYSAYTPSKIALRALSETLSQELLLYELHTRIKPHCVFPGTIFTPGYEAENRTKPGITKKLEEGDVGQTAEEVAKETLRKLERGEENITTSGLLGTAMKAGMLGGSRRSGWGIVETIISWIVTIVLVFERRHMDEKYMEEKDPSLWKVYLDRDQTRNMAMYGHPELIEEEQKEKESKAQTPAELSSPAELASNGTTPSGESAKTLTQEETHGHHMHSTLTNQRVDTEKGRDASMVSWFGDNDPEDVMKTFGVSQVKATLGLTLFVAGYGIGPMLWAPMSEIPQIGRNPIYIGTLIFFVVLQVPTALAKNFAMLLCFRFLTGFIGSPVLATGGASLGDMFAPKKRAYAIGIWGIAAVCGPVLGPLVGGFAAQAKGWSWTIWELMWLCSFSLVLFIFFLPETSASNILYRRTRRLRNLTGIQTLTCQPEIMSEQMTGKEVAMIALVRPIILNFQEPIVFLLNLYIALIYGLLYIWFESFPIVFTGIYRFNLGQEGLAFVGILVGAIIVIPPFFFYLYKYIEPQFNENGELPPEVRYALPTFPAFPLKFPEARKLCILTLILPQKRLPPAFVGAFAIPICLFWFGWSARPSLHWIMPIIGSGWFSIGAFLLFNSVLNYLGDAYPEYAASVLAGNDFMRSSFGAGFPLFASAMYKNLGVDWASSTLGFLSVAFIPIPFALHRYGRRIRLRSKHARHDL
ncbi:MAG: hypothetical protein Q9217_000901 [Psora testacea]